MTPLRRGGWPLALPAALLLGFLIAPFGALLANLPGTDLRSLPEAAPALGTSLVAATAATLLDGLVGIPLAYLLSGSRSQWKRLAVAAVALPLAVPPVVGGLELLLLLGRQGWLGAGLDAAGLSPVDSLAGTVLAQAFVAAPFIVIGARAAFDGIDPQITDAARVLGCGPLTAFLRAVLPAARAGVLAGLLLGWLRCMGEFGATAVLAYHPYTLPTLTFVDLSGSGLASALPAGALLALTGVLAAALMLWLEARGDSSRKAPEPDGGLPSQARLDWIQPALPARLQVRAAARLGGFKLDVELALQAGAIALLGPSGAGKSLTLRTVAGLFRPARGEVRLGDRVMLDTEAGVDVAAERRGVGYLGQRDGLFPHLDVEGNVGFGLRGLDRQERERRVGELLAAVGLEHRRHASPSTLSGGERQRVALARALAGSPRLLLLDEPFANLDTATRRGLRLLVRDLHERTGIPLVVVTHDREDALELADRVGVVDRGRVIQQGSVEEVFGSPQTPVVAELIGIENLLPVLAVRLGPPGLATAETALGQVSVPAPEAPAPGWVLAIPASALGADPSGVEAVVESVRWAGGSWRVRAVCGGARVELDVTGRRPGPSSRLGIAVDGSRCHLLAIAGKA